jgi:hypothetical protein
VSSLGQIFLLWAAQKGGWVANVFQIFRDYHVFEESVAYLINYGFVLGTVGGGRYNYKYFCCCICGTDISWAFARHFELFLSWQLSGFVPRSSESSCIKDMTTDIMNCACSMTGRPCAQYLRKSNKSSLAWNLQRCYATSLVALLNPEDGGAISIWTAGKSLISRHSVTSLKTLVLGITAARISNLGYWRSRGIA